MVQLDLNEVGEQGRVFANLNMSASSSLDYYTGHNSAGGFGFYYISELTEYTSIPPISGRAIFEVIGNTQRVMQRITSIESGTVYFRFYSGSWSSWRTA